MNKDKNAVNGWLSAHLFYEEPWDRFLTITVLPFVKSIFKTSYADRFFFVRYWEGGPHIRLRIHGNQNQIKKQVKPELIKYFSSYFLKKPSLLLEEKKKYYPSKKYFPNNSIQFIRYIPEIERYGGKNCIGIAETQFDLSSWAVIKAINENKKWDYETALGTALKLHLSLIHSMKLTGEESKLFFSLLAVEFTKLFYPKDLLNPLNPLSLYEKNFSLQRQVLVPYCNDFVKSLNTKSLSKDSYFFDWVVGMKKIYKLLVQKQNDDHYKIPEMFSFSKPVDISENIYNLFYIYQSFIHMTNNRLGIKNQDEGYLAFLLFKFFETR